MLRTRDADPLPPVAAYTAESCDYGNSLTFRRRRRLRRAAKRPSQQL